MRIDGDGETTDAREHDHHGTEQIRDQHDPKRRRPVAWHGHHNSMLIHLMKEQDTADQECRGARDRKVSLKLQLLAQHDGDGRGQKGNDQR
jgi:hypothetical protein